MKEVKMGTLGHIPAGALVAFVYGTLKRGYWNHDRFCNDAIHIEEATVRGRLYELPSGIPVLQVPDNYVLAAGSLDPLADVATQELFRARLTVATDHEKGWRMIHGELMVFPDARLSLPPIDRLEGFRPGLPSLYNRVLVPVTLEDGRWIPAWCYVGGRDVAKSMVPTGNTNWPQK
jgi:gamma-glutamylcyclotransferase (GGCT)/AIG2-like uncharacterized protein YtfP